MGNVRGLVDSSGNVSLQVFDAFGNPQGSGGIPAEATYVDFRCNSDCDFGDVQDADPPRPHEPVERIQKGSFAWRGGEGSQTDRLSRSVHYHESTPQERVAEAFTRPSTGLVYMQARYYDPAVGRFTQLDPVRYGPELFATGQNNRWTYCANDPINASDPSGLFPWIIVGIGVLAGAAIGYYFGGWQGALIGAPIGGIIAYVGALLFAEALLGGTAASGTLAFTVHGFERFVQRGYSLQTIMNVINNAETACVKLGRYGTPVVEYIKNGIHVVMETSGANAGKIITVYGP